MHMPAITRTQRVFAQRLRQLSALCVAGAALTVAANASAGTHYYALIQSSPVNGDADEGAFAELWTNILHSTCNIFTHEFATHEMWYAWDNGAYWTEVGFFDGATDGAGCKTQDVFWADNRNGGGYNEHDTGNSLTTGEWIPLEVETGGPGSCEWSVWWNETNIGLSTVNCYGSGRYLTAGIETTSQTTGSVQGWTSDWQEQSSSGIWQGWDGPPTLVQDETGGGGSGNPVIQWEWNKTGTEEVLNEGF